MSGVTFLTCWQPKKSTIYVARELLELVSILAQGVDFGETWTPNSELCGWFKYFNLSVIKIKPERGRLKSAVKLDVDSINH